jgi:dihydroorotase
MAARERGRRTEHGRVERAGAGSSGTEEGAGSLLLTGGIVIDPASGFSSAGDLVIEDGRIAAIGAVGEHRRSAAREIDASGLYVVPGLIDMHVHLREPGFEYKETIRSGAAAAVAGGFASVACMANTDPVNDNGAVTNYILDRARIAGAAEVFPIGALSVGLRGERLAEIGEMREAGIVAVSDDGQPVADSALMRRALEYCGMFGMPVIAHEEDPQLAAGGVMNEGTTALRLGLRGMPAAAEEVMVARDLALAELTGGHLHVAHVSTGRAVDLIRVARKRGVRVSAEASCHHLWLTEEAVEGYETNAKMNPPLRTAADVEALRVAVADGTVEVIASDHAPHHRDEKAVEFDAAAMGVIGLETTLPLVLRLVREKVLSLTDAIARLTIGPARVLGLPRGTLAVGAMANVTVIDPKRRWTVDPQTFRSKSRNTPFAGWDMEGRAVLTVVGGRVVYEDAGDGVPADTTLGGAPR